MPNTNTNTETGVAYGVIYGHNSPNLLEDIYDYGENLTYQSFIADCPDLPDDDYMAEEEEFRYTDSAGNEFLLGYLGGAPLIWCILTDKIVHARQCSPCVPDAGDLNSLDPYGFACYGVPVSYQGR